MKSSVITGSTRGKRHGLAKAFLEQDCQIVVSGRKQEDVDLAVRRLFIAHSHYNNYGLVCDVTSHDEVESLCEASVHL